MLSLRSALSMPRVYQSFQEAGGFFGARLKFLRRCDLNLDRIKLIDIGCGPGFIRPHLPLSLQYFGFDTDQRYINYARQQKQENTAYFCEPFGLSSAKITGQVEVVMMNGLLHHLDNQTAEQLLRDAAASLLPDGYLLTLDGCYRSGQSFFRKKILDWDRGKYVRTERQYLDLFKDTGLDVSTFLDKHASRVPYDFLCITARKQA